MEQILKHLLVLICLFLFVIATYSPGPSADKNTNDTIIIWKTLR